MKARKLLKYMIFLIMYWVVVDPINAIARQDVVPGSRFTNARAAAMGDAFLPLGDDGMSALFYNPALVGKFRKTSFDALNIQLSANQNYAANIDGNFLNVINLSNFRSTLASHIGDFMGAGGSLSTAFYGRGFAIGALYENQMYAAQSSDGRIHIKSRYQFIPSAATGIRLADGILKLGYSIQWVNQAVGNQSVDPATQPVGYTENIPQGSGFSHNAGVTLTLPTSYLPTFSVVARNILGTSYSGPSLIPFSSNSTSSPATENMTIDASFSVEPKLGRGGLLNLVLQMRDITNDSGVSLWGRACAGVEIDFRGKFAVRGGWRGGYPSLGIGVMAKKSQFSFTWYSEDIGVGRDIRYMVQLQLKAF